MSLEERWADRMEWQRDRHELEIKIEYRCTWYELCQAGGCHFVARMVYEVGEVARAGGTPIYLCDEHDEDTAFEVYRKMNSQGG